MGNNTLIILGMISLIIFNILVITISAVLVNTFGWTVPVIIVIVLFVIAAVYFDTLAIRYFINKIKNERYT